MKIVKPSYDKQKLELLRYNPDFTADIGKLRKKWKIPENGLELGKELEDWHKELIKISDDFAEKEIQNGIKNKDEINKKIPINHFQSDLKLIIEKYKLPDVYKDPIKGYLLAGVNSPIWQNNVRLWSEYVPDSPKNRVFLEIFAETTTKDIQKIWGGLVKPLQKNTIGYKESRKRAQKDFLIDKRILELNEKKFSHAEIAEKIRNEFGGNWQYYDIAIKLHRVRKKYLT
jgi:hypothetical protein